MCGRTSDARADETVTVIGRLLPDVKREDKLTNSSDVTNFSDEDMVVNVLSVDDAWGLRVLL